MSKEMIARAWAITSRRFKLGDAIIAFSCGAKLIVAPGKKPIKDLQSLCRKALSDRYDNDNLWAGGGTYMNAAKLLVEKLISEGAEVKAIVAITDGYVSDEEKQGIDEIILIDCPEEIIAISK